MASSFIARLYEEEKAGRVNVNIKAYAMGNSWIHPVDSTRSWAPFLYANVCHLIIS